MYTPDAKKRARRSTNLSLRISEATKEIIEQRAALRSRQQKKRIKPGQVARELIEYALAMTDDATGSSHHERLADEVMTSALFARRAFELVLSTHEGLAEKLLRASRAEVQHLKGGKSLGGRT